MIKPLHLFACSSGDINTMMPSILDFLGKNKVEHHPFTAFQTKHPLYVAGYSERLAHLSAILQIAQPSILWALRGGCGTTSLLPALKSIIPQVEHTVIGFSDVTALHLFCNRIWGWKSIHGPTLNYVQHTLGANFWESVVHFVVTGQISSNIYDLIPLNDCATSNFKATGLLTGGNMSLIQSSIGTFWQIDATEKIIFFEDINEQPYRIAERLEHLSQVGLFKQTRAIIFGDFTSVRPTPQTDLELLSFVLTDFASRQSCPVFKNLPVGHAQRNILLVLNHPATIEGGHKGKFNQFFSY